MINKFKYFESNITSKDVRDICGQYKITNYIINDDMSISVNNNVYLAKLDLLEIPIKFKSILGSFYCDNNQLTSLKYCPKIVSGSFYCHNNQLTSLEGCPETVGDGFNCSNNSISSLVGSPIKYNDRLIPSYYQNNITNFDGLPEFFESDIDLGMNPVDEIHILFNRDPRCIYWIREFGAIQGDEVVRDRLEEVYHTLGISIPKDIKLKEYILV